MQEKSFLENFVEKKKTLAYLLLGPLFLSFTVSFFSGFLLVFAAIAGLILCWQWRIKGFIIALLGLICLHFTAFSMLPAVQKMVQMSIETCLVLSWLITTLCLEEIAAQIAALRPKEKSPEESIYPTRVQIVNAVNPVEIKNEPELAVIQAEPAEAVDYDLQQLRRQFEEKSEVLHKTRKDLFNMENAYLILQKEIEHKDCDLLACEKEFLDHVRQVEEERKELELHTQQLQELVTFFLSKEKLKKPAKKEKMQPTLPNLKD